MGWNGAFSVPSMLVQLVFVADQVPVPPSIVPLATIWLPSQKPSVWPLLLRRLTCPATAVCTKKSLAGVPPGVVPMARPLFVSVPP